MRGNPSGNFVPECEPRKGVSWRLTQLDAKSYREDSAGSPDTQSLVLDSICYTKRFRIVQGGNKKSYRRVRDAILTWWSDRRSSPVPRLIRPSPAELRVRKV